MPDYDGKMLYPSIIMPYPDNIMPDHAIFITIRDV